MDNMKVMFKDFRNRLLTVYYTEGQELSNEDRRIIEKIINSLETILSKA